ncbi:MAG TPA: alpha/beta fold hydrolase [Rickettsiales bacterium]|nr:alpha/beta fold hydrolase [Rickettsiales bacterium]
MCNERIWELVYPHLDSRLEKSYIALERCPYRQAMLQAIREAAVRQGPLNVAAFSMGGYIAIEYALMHPHDIQSLAIVGASAFGLQENEKRDRQKVMDALARHPYKGLSEHRIQQLLLPSHQADETIREVLYSMDQALGRDVLLAQLQETTTRPCLENQLTQLRCPVLLVGSQHDNIVAKGDMERMQQLIPDCELHMLEDTGHMITLEAPQALAGLLNHFFLNQ